MPLSAQEKNDLVLASTLSLGLDARQFTEQALARRNPVVSGVFGTVVADLLSALNPVVPRAPPIGGVLSQLRDIRRRGLEPRLSTDPFFGDVVLSTRDQDPFLDELVSAAAIRRLTANPDTSAVFFARQRLGEELARTAEARGFRTSIDPNLRGGVFRATAESPLEFIEGDFLNAPR